MYQQVSTRSETLDSVYLLMLNAKRQPTTGDISLQLIETKGNIYQSTRGTTVINLLKT